MNVNINGIGIGSYQESLTENKKSKAGQEFKNALMGGFLCKEEKQLDRKIVNTAGLSVIARNRVAEIGATYSDAIKECEVRNITMQESDYVKSCPTEGCMYKALVDTQKGIVYVEKKADDGTVRGYEIEVSKISTSGENPIEMLAVAAWQKVLEEQQKVKVEDVDIAAAFQTALVEFAEYVEDRIENGETKIAIGGQEYSQTEWNKLMEAIDKAIDEMKKQAREEAEKAVEEEKKQKWLEKQEMENRAPYSWLADENNCIIYNGVTFYCDYKTNSINLGDTSNPENVLSIPLSDGGTLNVNRDDLDDLGRAIGMFSSEDVKRIMQAIATDTQCRRKLLEIEEQKNNAENFLK